MEINKLFTTMIKRLKKLVQIQNKTIFKKIKDEKELKFKFFLK